MATYVDSIFFSVKQRRSTKVSHFFSTLKPNVLFLIVWNCFFLWFGGYLLFWVCFCCFSRHWVFLVSVCNHFNQIQNWFLDHVKTLITDHQKLDTIFFCIFFNIVFRTDNFPAPLQATSSKWITKLGLDGHWLCVQQSRTSHKFNSEFRVTKSVQKVASFVLLIYLSFWWFMGLSRHRIL